MTGGTLLLNIGRIFYGLAMGALGFLTIYYRDFPYMMIPPDHGWISSHLALPYLFGVFLLLTGAGIAIGRNVLSVSLTLGTVLLLIFCFYFLPYQLFVSPDAGHYGAWENAAKELALASGAFAIAAYESTRTQRPLSGFWRKLIAVGAACFPLTIISFSIDHFLYARAAVDYMPTWISYRLQWLYITGSALLGAGLAILLSIRVRLFAGLLGSMIFIWVLIIHMPKCIAASGSDSGGEVTSGLLALAYCGIAFFISGAAARSVSRAAVSA